ncbi:S-adenosyl-L-methionine-dependent methyltransferase [Pyrrhoderma noxium]|uniref:rRNA adenine N(6)-methyltransferase n=1 Tax=Pyrrhoderma noxium TaxID=2282107 RepID=A0A286UGG8_9AGAM|nr:S-adenosyl-L-methionine-dependent methyltransferase [Pyrrhoderma noxium]
MLAVRTRIFFQPRALRCYRSVSTLPPLPPREEWKSLFPSSQNQGRVFLQNEQTADRIAEGILTGPDGREYEGEPKVIIESFPGPGALTRSLTKLPPSKVKKIIVLEDVDRFRDYVKPLEEYDSRVTVVPLSGYTWSTYPEIEALGLLKDVITREWADEIPNLHFVSHIPHTVLGDQLLAQLWRIIPERSWLFKYGRVPMSFILSELLHERVVAAPGVTKYNKLSVIASATSEIRDIVPAEDLKPYPDHFWPTGGRGHGHRITGTPFVAINVFPTIESCIQPGLIDKWDYVLRRLFVLKSTKLDKAINSLGPGANHLLRVIADPSKPKSEQLDLTKTIRRLTLDDFKVIVKAFDEWPFAPEDLGIRDPIYKNVERD